MQTIVGMLYNLIMHQCQQQKYPNSLLPLLEEPKTQRFFDITHHALAFDALLSQALINSAILLKEVIAQRQWSELLTDWVEVVECEDGVVLQLTKGVELAQLRQVKNRWLLTNLLIKDVNQSNDKEALLTQLKAHYVQQLDNK